MPRETVHRDKDFRTEVVWARGTYAQLGVVSDEPVDVADTHGTYSLWSDMSVEDIDRLMKVLRRVKRQLLESPDRDKDEKYKPLS